MLAIWIGGGVKIGVVTLVGENGVLEIGEGC
jgi:hypothetical protein